MIDFDALVLGPTIGLLGGPALLAPVVSQPGTPAYPVWGVFVLKGADIQQDDGSVLRADDYTFGVRASEFDVLVQRGDLVSAIEHPSFVRFLEGRTFVIDDTGDDGMGGQSWVLKDVREQDIEP